MNPLDYSKQFNLWLTSDSTEYQKLIESLLHEIKLELNPKRFRAAKYKKSLFHILADLFITHKADSKRYLAFSRDSAWFSTGTRYQPKNFARDPFEIVVKFLESNGYIEATKGFYDRKTGNSRNSRMIAMDKLIKLFDAHKITTANFYQLDTKESIILKSPKDENDNTSKVDYEDTVATIAMRKNLKLINRNIGKHWVDLKVTDKQFSELQEKLYIRATSDNQKDKYKSPVDFTRTNQVRIFNNGDADNPQFNQGGRFYGGWWLSIPSAYRSRIRINGKKTVELDYSAMHFYMMYAEKGLAIPYGDPYTLDGIDRKKAKLALNTALNASSKEKAISAIKRNQWPDKTKDEVTTIIDKLLAKHKAISEYFYTGKGLKLQYKDSQVAELVMLNMWNKYGVIVLPVHDSFIVAAASYDALKAEMLAAFDEITGYTAKMKANEPDETLKSTLDRLAQQVMYIDSTQLPKVGVGVNAADTWDAYKQEQDGYKGYRLREEQNEFRMEK